MVGKLLEQDNPDLGYDAAKGKPADVYSGQSPVPLESCCARSLSRGGAVSLFVHCIGKTGERLRMRHSCSGVNR